MLNKTKSEMPLIVIRVFLLGQSFITNILIANFLMTNYGVSFYAYYSALIAIPNLLPFADFGLGMAIFNQYSIAKNGKGNLIENREFSSIFWALTFSSVTCAILSIIVVQLLGGHFLALIISQYSAMQVAIVILLLTWAAIPFTIGLRKLEGQGKVEWSQLIQGLIPIFTVIGIFIPKALGFNVGIWISCVPAASYFAIILIGFVTAQGLDSLVSMKVSEIRYRLNTVKGVAFWSLAYSTLIMLTFQVPKFLLISQGQIDASASYSYSLLFVLPIISLGMSSANWLAPRSRQMSWNYEKFVFLRKNTLRSLFFICIIYLTSILIRPIAMSFGLSFPAAITLILDMIFVISYLVWQIPFSSMTESADFRRMTIQLIILIIIFSGLWMALFKGAYETIIICVFIPTNILLGVVTWQGVAKRKSQS